MLNTTIIPAPRVPLVDPETGLISTEWYRYLFNLFTLTGAGGNAISLDDLQVGPPVQESTVTGGGGGSVNSVTGSAPISSTGGANPNISISQATTSTNGYLSSTDWNTFNSKGSGTVTSVTGTSPVTSSGGTAPAISLAAAYGDTLNPYASKTANYVLASPDGLAGVPTFRAVVAADIPTLNQNTTGSAATLTTGRTIAITGDLAYTSPSFDGSTNVTAAGTLATVNTNVGSFTNASLTVNGKGLITAASSGTAPVTSVTGTTPVVSSGGTTPAISMPAATTTVSGYLTSTDWNTFNSKGSGTVTSVTGTTPVVSSGGATPAISMAAANTTTNGYLTSTDWNTFNGKSNTNGTVTSVAALTLGTTGTDLSSTVATGTTTPVITLQVPTASATNRGALSAADWTTFNNKGSGTVTSVTGTSPVVSSGGTTPAISLAASYGDTLNPYASKTANFILAAPNGSAGVPTFRAVVAADIPTLNQNTTGSAGSVANALTIGTGLRLSSGTTYNGSAALTLNAPGTTLNSQTSAYVLVAGDAGKMVSITTGGVTVNNSVMSAGDIVTIYNNSASSQTITQGTGVTLQWAGQTVSTTGNRTLGLRGIATIVFLSASSAVISGAGLT